MTAEEALEIIVDMLGRSASTRFAVLNDIETLAISYDDMDFEVERRRSCSTVHM